MPTKSAPASEVTIDGSLVRGLLQEQHADLAHLALVKIGEGWDNQLYRLGDDLIARLPRRAAAAVLIEHEQRWLPQLAPRLPLRIPYPLRTGRPGCGFPWSWSITPWFAGQSAAITPPVDAEAAALALAEFLRALHQPGPGDAPRNAWRGVPLSDRTARLHEHVVALEGAIDPGVVLGLWAKIAATPPWSGPPLWIHGDLHPGNILVSDGRLSAVIDFGDLTAGDPATDLSVAWMLLPRPARMSFRALTCGPSGWLDDHTWNRARGWALAIGLAFLANSSGDGIMSAIAHAALSSALDDESR
jgi:aminoglycoside phosphotransferase (APT) family kinase protein